MRESQKHRKTFETDVVVAVNLDTDRPLEISTNLPLFTHFLTAMGKHGHTRWQIQATGDIEVDPHHLVEDVGIVMGQVLREAVGDGHGIYRYGQRYVPMDDALVLCALDISGRGQLYLSGDFPDRMVNGVNAEVWPEFFRAFAAHSGITLHLVCQAGHNAHHVYEATFKALGQALWEAVRINPEWGIPSTKGVL
ncbi:MAG: imidazoleglycerol-phosphate dehydratase HisB [Sulfobacillus thermosulfidooxidans]|uniref:Imidazoleglycerol-phosphate dehydratase n=1 Tax=Sulfobacillus thermotolerans TaxID=338644 RepID=A0ABN5GXP6_9FIRM|nr:imidazoleglycerol-phosphate dehydratase HisB [Sulfobacillus sp. hq2]AUW93282.1 imidazoleglycerol-phosphate dehydratase [Sulfobacillus thermotolerans]MCY0907381.1 imidazoleglycerol-phosphate dehydratase HisB [Sulfobacillus thermotolerans]POB11638.1 imidazoleglycerol-phosphate dehydratase [Sulfobacillus sp. hq2]PSR36023.1 MAG: imidazoleglycerol-phosphate dehydratase HisB [Sulfobacillus thermosulfidooxidans]